MKLRNPERAEAIDLNDRILIAGIDRISTEEQRRRTSLRREVERRLEDRVRREELRDELEG